MPNKYTMGANGLELVIEGGGGSSVTLYDTTGQNTDGAMTQKATTDALNDKVDKETGKGLSTNDFTTADKDKLEGIEDDAQKNVQSDWAQTDNTKDDFIKNKPTKVSDFTNDSKFQTETEVTDAINNKLTTVMDYKGSVATYDDLPTSDVKTGDVYNVVDTGNNYAWDGTVWDKLGDTVDLSGYYTSTEVDGLLDDKLDKDTSVTENRKAYVKETDGTQMMLTIDAWSPSSKSIVERDGSGRIYASDPTYDNQVATKNYVDRANDGKLDKVSTSGGYERAYVVNTDGSQKLMDIVGGATGSTIVKRNSAGQFSCATPTADAHVTNKKYVDDANQVIQTEIATGKNLFRPITSDTANGITFTLNDDGSYDITGTATAQATLSRWIGDTSYIEDGETYTFSATPNLPDGVQVAVDGYANWTWSRSISGYLGSNKSISTQAANMTGITRLAEAIIVENGTTVDIHGLKIQWEKGSTATAYAEYTGGLATREDLNVKLDTKLDKVNTTGDELLYGVDNQGVQKMVKSHVANDPWTVAYRNGNGVFSTGTPTANEHVANKGYVDSKHVALTQAEYNALSDDEKMSDRVYMITDGDRPNVSLELPVGIPGVATAYSDFTGDAATNPPAMYSPHGYSYSWDGGNGGTSTKIISGGSHVTAFRASWAARYTAGQAGNIGIHNVKNNVYSTWWGIKSGTAVSPEKHSYTASATGYSDAISGSSGAVAARLTFQGVKDPNGSAWMISGDYVTSGTDTYLHFIIRCEAANPEYIPTLYQRGATQSNVSDIYWNMEMDEI